MIEIEMMLKMKMKKGEMQRHFYVFIVWSLDMVIQGHGSRRSKTCICWLDDQRTWVLVSFLFTQLYPLASQGGSTTKWHEEYLGERSSNISNPSQSL